jgi:hypothetical protein
MSKTPPTTKIFIVRINGKEIAALNAANADEEAAFEEANLPLATPEQAKQWEASRARHAGMSADPHRWIARID